MYFTGGLLRMVYQFAQTESMNYPITQLCDVLQLSRSSYYAYCAGDVTLR